MKLLDLDARFIGNVDVAKKSSRRQDGIEGAQGVMFQCPKCGEGKERGRKDGRGYIKGAHYIKVCFSNPRGATVAPEAYDDNPRWEMSGTSLEDLTLKPSINCDIPNDDGTPSHCKFHGFVTNGDVA